MKIASAFLFFSLTGAVATFQALPVVRYTLQVYQVGTAELTAPFATLNVPTAGVVCSEVVTAQTAVSPSVNPARLVWDEGVSTQCSTALDFSSLPITGSAYVGTVTKAYVDDAGAVRKDCKSPTGTVQDCVATSKVSNEFYRANELTLTCPVGPSVQAAGPVAVTFQPPVQSGGIVPVSSVCSPASGTTFQLGTTAVSCTATDVAQRTATCTFSVTVTALPAPKPCDDDPLAKYVRVRSWPGGQTGNRGGDWASGTKKLNKASFEWNPLRFVAVDDRGCEAVIRR